MLTSQTEPYKAAAGSIANIERTGIFLEQLNVVAGALNGKFTGADESFEIP